MPTIPTNKSNLPTTNETRPQHWLKLLGLLFLIFAILAIATFASLYSKNYKQLKTSYNNPVQLAHASFLKLDFQQETGSIKLKGVSIVDSHPTALPKKPEDGYQINVIENEKSTYETYIYKNQDSLTEVIPQKPASQIIVKSTKDDKVLLTLSYDEIAKNAAKEAPLPTPNIRRNIVKDALYLTWQQIKAKFIKENAPTAQPTTTTIPFFQLKSYQDAKNKVIYKLPYQKDGIKIEYEPKSETITTTIRGKNIDEYRKNKQEAENYLKQFQENLCDLHLFWYTDVPFKKDLLGNDSKTSGCSF